MRLPLPKLTVGRDGCRARSRQFEDILRDELNVKAVELVELGDGVAERYGISSGLTVNARAAGPRLGKQVQHVIAGAKAGVCGPERGRRGRRRRHRGSTRASTSSPSRRAAPRRHGARAARARRVRPARHRDDARARGRRASPATSIRAVQDTRKAAGLRRRATASASALLFSDAEDADAVASAFDIADVAGRPSPSSTASSSPDADVQVPRRRPGGHVASWVFGHLPEHVVFVPVGTYANRGGFHVAVTRKAVSQ